MSEGGPVEILRSPSGLVTPKMPFKNESATYEIIIVSRGSVISNGEPPEVIGGRAHVTTFLRFGATC